MVKHTDYNWRGDDGSVVFTTQIPFGYYIGGNIPEEPEEKQEGAVRQDISISQMDLIRHQSEPIFHSL